MSSEKGVISEHIETLLYENLLHYPFAFNLLEAESRNMLDTWEIASRSGILCACRTEEKLLTKTLKQLSASLTRTPLYLAPAGSMS